MDPITLAITSALGNLGVQVINDAYQALKAALQAKYGLDSNLAKAVNALEDEPDFKPNQDALAERVMQVKAADDPQLQQLTQALIQALESTTDGYAVVSKYQIDARNAQVGVIADQVNVEGGIHFGTTRDESKD